MDLDQLSNVRTLSVRNSKTLDLVRITVSDRIWILDFELVLEFWNFERVQHRAPTLENIG